MKKIWNVLKARRQEIEAHSFFAWFASESVPKASRFVFTPVMIDFIMGFADLNKWFLRYNDPSGTLEEAINEHTEEDSTHSRLFVQNWEHLELGETLDWPASKALWWMFHSSRGLAVRRFGMNVMRLAVELQQPSVRFPMMEAIEICGDVFFAHTAPIAEQLMREKQELNYVYYGQYHRERETGHLQADEGCFMEVVLSNEERRQAERGVNQVFDDFLGVLDVLAKFSQSALADYRALQRSVEREYLLALLPPAEDRSERPVAASGSSILPDRGQSVLLDLIDRRQDHLRSHAFLGWLREASMPGLEKLQGFTPLWGIDILGYRDFNEIVLSYPEAENQAEQSMNAWTKRLASHGRLFLQDWKALRLDSVLGWTMGDTIAYYFLSEDTEVHRGNMAKVKKHAFQQSDPTGRAWILYALECAGVPLFEATRGVALQVEQERGITLNYWAGRHGFAEPETGLAFDFFRAKMTNEQEQVLIEAIETIFDNLNEQLALSHDVAASGVFAQRPASLPPPRISEVVPAGSRENSVPDVGEQEVRGGLSSGAGYSRA